VERLYNAAHQSNYCIKTMQIWERKARRKMLRQLRAALRHVA
jgi:hypothetical protein